jgi:hypothetical protein
MGFVLLLAMVTVARAETYLGYESQTAGFGIAYPKTWTVTENPERTAVVLSEKTGNPATRANVIASSGPASPGVKLDDYDRIMPKLFNLIFENYKQHLKQPTTLGGVAARMLLFEAMQGKSPIVGFIAYTIRNGKVFSVMFFSSKGQYEGHRQVGGNILSTFRFL